jgi:hypothetical protein
VVGYGGAAGVLKGAPVSPQPRGWEVLMRAEMAHVAHEIEQGLALLRRHL